MSTLTEYDTQAEDFLNDTGTTMTITLSPMVTRLWLPFVTVSVVLA